MWEIKYIRPTLPSLRKDGEDGQWYGVIGDNKGEQTVVMPGCRVDIKDALRDAEKAIALMNEFIDLTTPGNKGADNG